MKKGTKDLSLLWDTFKLSGYTKENTVILDDYDEVYKTQPENCIIVVPFEFNKDNSDSDNFFNKLMPQMRILNEKIKSGESISSTVVETNKKTKK